MKASTVRSLCALAISMGAVAAVPARAADLDSLEGTWFMDSAYEIHPDGSRTTNYGELPLGMLTVDHSGRYNLQIFRRGRPAFEHLLQML